MVREPEKASMAEIIAKLNEAFGEDTTVDDVNAAMDAQDAHMTMSNKLLNSPEVLNGVLDILLNHSRLWEALPKTRLVKSANVRGRETENQEWRKL